MKPTAHDVTITGEHFERARRLFAELVPSDEAGQALFSLRDGRLHITVAGVGAAIPCTGTWLTEVRAANRIIPMLAVTKCSGDTLRITVQNGRLHFAEVSVSCVLQEPDTHTVDVPFSPGIHGLIELGAFHTAEELEHAGLTQAVAAARRRRSALVNRAAGELEESLREVVKILSPLHPTQADVMDVYRLAVSQLRLPEAPVRHPRVQGK